MWEDLWVLFRNPLLESLESHTAYRVRDAGRENIKDSVNITMFSIRVAAQTRIQAIKFKHV
jgi:hypothetical protein